MVGAEGFEDYPPQSAIFLTSHDIRGNYLKLSDFPEVSGFPCCL